MYVHDFIVSFLSGSASDHQGNHGLGHLGGLNLLWNKQVVAGI
jgi:hypothetical protein